MTTNKYLTKSSSFTAAALHFLTGGATTHLVQNGVTRAGLRNKHVAQSVANHFRSGLAGVHDTSLTAKAMSAVRGTLAPDLEILHHNAWKAGEVASKVNSKLSNRQRVGVRMLLEGRQDKFQKLKSRMKFSEPIIKELDETSSKILSLGTAKKVAGKVNKENLVSLGKAIKSSPETAKKMADVWHDKNNPLLSNIGRNITRGHLPKVHKPGPPSTAIPMIAGIGSGLAVGDSATSIVNGLKNSTLLEAAKKNKYYGKVIDKLHEVIVKHPIKAGLANPNKDFLHGIKNKVMEYGWSPTSQTLKHTTGQIASTLNKGGISPGKTSELTQRALHKSQEKFT